MTLRKLFWLTAFAFLLSLKLDAKHSIPLVDLALEMISSNDAPNQYDAYSLTITLNNAGEQMATGISVAVEIPEGVLLIGGNEYTATHGIFDSYYAQTWEVESLAAGAEATLQLNLFQLGAIPGKYYAQVSACAEKDIDSTPGNGICCTGHEDDEANTSTPILEKPDLLGANWDLAYEIEQNKLTPFTFAVNNIGSAALGHGFATGCYVSTDPSP